MSDAASAQRRKLQVGEHHTCAIQARAKWNDSGVEVVPDEHYRLKATGCWFDASIQTGPAGYVSERWIFRLTERFRRMPMENWFALIGAVGQDESSAFAVGEGTSVAIRSGGTLNFFANDLPLLYGNNSGAISLEITREA